MLRHYGKDPQSMFSGMVYRSLDTLPPNIHIEYFYVPATLSSCITRHYESKMFQAYNPVSPVVSRYCKVGEGTSKSILKNSQVNYSNLKANEAFAFASQHGENQ
jgi:hypothetical protein